MNAQSYRAKATARSQQVHEIQVLRELLKDSATWNLFWNSLGEKLASSQLYWESLSGQKAPYKRASSSGGIAAVSRSTTIPSKPTTVPSSLSVSRREESRPATTGLDLGRTSSAPVSQEPPIWKTCWRLATVGDDTLDLDRSARNELLFAGGKNFYATEIAKMAGPDGSSASVQEINDRAHSEAHAINQIAARVGEWRLDVISWGDMFDGTRCQYVNEAKTTGGVTSGARKIRPLSFAIYDLKKQTIRNRAWVEAMT